MALSTIWLSSRLFGMIPGPIVIGKLIDKSCTLWNTASNGCGDATATRLNCLRYDIRQFSVSIMLIGRFCA